MSAVRAFINANKKKHDRDWDTLYVSLDIHETVMAPNWQGLSSKIYPWCIEALIEMQKNPVYKTIMWTCSKEADRIHYKKILEGFGVDIYAVNDNPDMEGIINWGDYSQKMYTNVLLDDKSGFDPMTEWKELYDYFVKENSKI